MTRRDAAISVLFDILGDQGDRAVYHMMFILLTGLVGVLLIERLEQGGASIEEGRVIGLAFEMIFYVLLANLFVKPVVVHGLRSYFGARGEES